MGRRFDQHGSRRIDVTLNDDLAVGRALEVHGSALVCPHPSKLPQLVLVPGPSRGFMEHGVERGRVHLRHLALNPLPTEPLRHVEYGHAPTGSRAANAVWQRSSTGRGNNRTEVAPPV